jgi:outer membrane protein insertion porin family
MGHVGIVKKRIADESKPDGRRSTSCTKTLFFEYNPVEISAENDTINFMIRTAEASETFFGSRDRKWGTIRQNDHVIYRNCAT